MSNKIQNLKRRGRNYYNVFTGILNGNGKKHALRKVFSKGYEMASDTFRVKGLQTGDKDIPVGGLAYNVVKGVTILVETKDRRRGHNTYIVPTPVNTSKRVYLAARNFARSLRINPIYERLKKKMSKEIININLDRHALAKSYSAKLDKKEEVVRYKSYTHFNNTYK